MSTPVETLTDVEGITIEIHYDSDTESPRDNDGNTGTFMLDHGRYNLPMEAGDDVERAFRHFLDLRNGLNLFARYMRQTGQARIVVPVWGYDHGQLALSAGKRAGQFSDQWDSGLAGVVFVSQETLDRNGIENVTDEELETWVDGEVKEFDQWQRGECYGYVLKNTVTDETLESVWGFIGDEYVTAEAISAAQCEVKHLVVPSGLGWPTTNGKAI